MNETWFTPNELADKLKISEQTVRLWVRQGKVKARKFGRAWRIPGAEVERVLEQGINEGENEDKAKETTE